MQPKILVVDDSAVMRQLLRQALDAAPSIGEVETAADGVSALAKIERFDPDIVTLDVEMPGLDGVATLRKIMSRSPRPVIMLSAVTSRGAARTLAALELGAVDFIQKPNSKTERDMAAVVADLVQRIDALAADSALCLRLRRARPRHKRHAPPEVRLGPRARATAATMNEPRRPAMRVVAIGASTGGPEAVRSVLVALPATLDAGVVVAIHMPEDFTGAYANRLHELCALEVKEAVHHDPIVPGRVLVAPGHSHMVVRRGPTRAFVELHQLPPVNGHRPSIDLLLESVAEAFGPFALGLLLTGMGKDGAAGLGRMRAAGAQTFAQDEASCVVYGMPKVAIETGAASRAVTLAEMPVVVQGWIARSGRSKP